MNPCGALKKTNKIKLEDVIAILTLSLFSWSYSYIVWDLKYKFSKISTL